MKTNTTNQETKSQTGTEHHYNFEVVKEFTYLGAEINASNDESREVPKRVSAAANCTFFSILPKNDKYASTEEVSYLRSQEGSDLSESLG